MPIISQVFSMVYEQLIYLDCLEHEQQDVCVLGPGGGGRFTLRYRLL